MKRAVTRRPGLTLVEMLVVVALMGLITTLVAVLFSQAQASFELGSGRYSADTKAREAFRRLSPLLTSAFSPTPGGGGSIYAPMVPGAQGIYVTFSTTEDWLEADYPSVTTSATVYNPTPNPQIQYFVYRIQFVTPGAGHNGQVWLYKCDPLPPYNALTSIPPPRVLVRGTRDAVLTNLVFTKLYESSNVIQMDLSVRSWARTVTGQTRDVVFNTRSSINVACESLR